MSPFAQSVLDNVTEEVRPQVAYALELAAASEPLADLIRIALTLGDYANDMASGALRGRDGQSYEAIGREDLARVEAALAKAGATS